MVEGFAIHLCTKNKFEGNLIKEMFYLVHHQKELQATTSPGFGQSAVGGVHSLSLTNEFGIF